MACVRWGVELLGVSVGDLRLGYLFTVPYHAHSSGMSFNTPKIDRPDAKAKIGSARSALPTPSWYF